MLAMCGVTAGDLTSMPGGRSRQEGEASEGSQAGVEKTEA